MKCILKLHTDSGLIEPIETEVGKKIIEAINTDHSLNAPCGGRGTCGKCRVKASGKLSEPTETERGLLSASDMQNGIRLACLTTIKGDAEVWLSEEEAKILLDGGKEESIGLQPSFTAINVRIPEASLDDQRSDARRLCEVLGVKNDQLTLAVLKDLPSALRNADHNVWIVKNERNGQIVRIAAAEPEMYGAAIDIGTTTIAAYLIDLKTGETVASRSAMNPQRAYGADVISRTDYSKKENGLDTLQKAIADKIDEMICDMVAEKGKAREDIYHIVCVGNTVMVHLLAGVTPENIAASPFIPAFTAPVFLNAPEIGMAFSNAMLEIGPCVAGYIGADTTAAALACAMDEYEGKALLIDIGTNGEIALGGRDGIVCCSAAAGPAFEGAHIRCGSGAVTGAISSVKLSEDGEVALETIGGTEPTSICGSGIVDAVAEMLRVGLIDETGRIDEDEAPEVWEDRLFDSPAGLAFALTDDKKVFICQKDIREVQLAKSAIAAGIHILLKKSKVGFANVEKLYLAGGFGNYIDVHNACMIGLLPAELEDKTEAIGNAAGTGARYMTLNTTACGRTEDMAYKMEYIELSSQRDFTELFSENMLFEI